MHRAEHEKLHIYQKALLANQVIDRICRRIPADRGLRDQLREAAESVALNIAEGAGEWRKAEKARFYRIALRSAGECMATLDVAAATGLPDPEHDAARGLLDEVISLGILLIRGLDQRA